MNYFELIKKWASDRNLIEGSHPRAQLLKLYEEFGELNAALARCDKAETKDAIGDMVVVMCIMSAQIGRPFKYGPSMQVSGKTYGIICEIGFYLGNLSTSIKCENKNLDKDIRLIMGLLAILAREHDLFISDCVKSAYDEIKDRKGVMKDGVFIKEK